MALNPNLTFIVMCIVIVYVMAAENRSYFVVNGAKAKRKDKADTMKKGGFGILDTAGNIR